MLCLYSTYVLGGMSFLWLCLFSPNSVVKGIIIKLMAMHHHSSNIQLTYSHCTHLSSKCISTEASHHISKAYSLKMSITICQNSVAKCGDC